MGAIREPGARTASTSDPAVGNYRVDRREENAAQRYVVGPRLGPAFAEEGDSREFGVRELVRGVSGTSLSRPPQEHLLVPAARGSRPDRAAPSAAGPRGREEGYACPAARSGGGAGGTPAPPGDDATERPGDGPAVQDMDVRPAAVGEAPAESD